MQARTEDEHFMQLALVQADLALGTGDVPVGAIVVAPGGYVIGVGRNRREADHDPTAHAEILALRAAASRLGDWRLAAMTVYATVEPCPMCAGALLHARIARVVYGCADPKAGALGSTLAIGTGDGFNHRFEVEPAVMADACARRLQIFFGLLRAAGEK